MQGLHTVMHCSTPVAWLNHFVLLLSNVWGSSATGFALLVLPADRYADVRLVDDTKLSGTADAVEGWNTIQRDLDKLEKWVHVNLIRFNESM